MADFTIADVLAWARTKPADEQYDYWCDRCAIGQFLVETDRAAQPTMGGAMYYDGSGGHEIPPEIDQAAYCEEFGPSNTFGLFVARLEALCPETPVTQAGWAAVDAYLTDIDAVSADKLAPAHIQPHTV